MSKTLKEASFDLQLHHAEEMDENTRAAFDNFYEAVTTQYPEEQDPAGERTDGQSGDDSSEGEGED